MSFPYTHSPPDPDRPDDRIELPAGVKARLRLDDKPSWIVLTEFNRFTYPTSAYDLESLPDGRASYGRLSSGEFKTVTGAVAEIRRRRQLVGVDRGD